MSKNNEKTNVCRLLDGKKINYSEHCYPPEEAVSAIEVAAFLQEPPQRVYKLSLIHISEPTRPY